METLPECCLGLGRMLTSVEQLAKHPAMVQDTSGPAFEEQEPTDVFASEPKSNGTSNPLDLVDQQPGSAAEGNAAKKEFPTPSHI